VPKITAADIACAVMRSVFGPNVIAAFVTIGIAALGVLTAQELSSPSNHVACHAFPNSDQRHESTAT
jgi:hypothetical protein